MSFFRSVAVLVSGTAIGHAITAAALPVLSRLYTPADFSVLAVFTGIIGILAVAACFRFEVAIALPESDSEAINLLALAVLSTVGISVVLGLIVWLAPEWVARTTRQPRLAPFLWLVPLAILLAGVYAAMQNWCVRNKEFGVLAKSRVVQSAASASVQIGMGLSGLAPIGLLVGNAINSGSASLGLGYRFLADSRNKTLLKTVSGSSLLATFKTYNRYPKYSTPEALFNSAALQLPIILIAALAAGPEAGYLIMAMSVMQAPMALFGTAIGQVYVSQAAIEHRNGNIGKFTSKICGKLAIIGVGPIAAAGILAPSFFPILFGAEWQRAGWLIAWMTPWFIFQFLTSPLSVALHITENQRAALLLQAGGLIFRIVAVASASILSAPMGEVFAISNAIFYLVHLAFVLHLTKSKNHLSQLLSIKFFQTTLLFIGLAIAIEILRGKFL